MLEKQFLQPVGQASVELIELSENTKPPAGTMAVTTKTESGRANGGKKNSEAWSTQIAETEISPYVAPSQATDLRGPVLSTTKCDVNSASTSWKKQTKRYTHTHTHSKLTLSSSEINITARSPRNGARSPKKTNEQVQRIQEQAMEQREDEASWRTSGNRGLLDLERHKTTKKKQTLKKKNNNVEYLTFDCSSYSVCGCDPAVLVFPAAACCGWRG